MPTFSTNPKWYNSAGVLDRSLTGVANKNSGYDNIAIGYNSQAGSSSVTSGINSAIAIGYDAIANSTDSIAIGSRSSEDYGTYATGMGAVALGSGASAGGAYAISIGNGAVTDEERAIQLGNNDNGYALTIGNIKDSGVNVGSVSCSNLNTENIKALNATINGKTTFNGGATFNGALTIPNKGFDAMDPLGTEELSLSDADKKEKTFSFPFDGNYLNTLKSGHGVVAFEIIGRKNGTTTVYGPYLIQFPSSTSTHVLKYYSASDGNYQPELLVVLESSIGSKTGNIKITLRSNAIGSYLNHYMSTVQFQMIRIANLSFTQPV